MSHNARSEPSNDRVSNRAPRPQSVLMSREHDPLSPGEPIFHPKFGFGTIHGMTRRERIQTIQETTSAGAQADHTEDYYDIRLREGGTLLVPISRAESVGLRRLTGGIEATKAGLYSPREACLTITASERSCCASDGQLAEPGALAHSVRDLSAKSRGRTLSPSEKTWLEKACQCLSTEAALVESDQHG